MTIRHKTQSSFLNSAMLQSHREIFKNVCLISKPCNRPADKISNGRCPNIHSFKFSPDNSNVQAGLGVTMQCKDCRNVEGKIFAAPNVLRQKSNRFCCLFLFSLIISFSQGWGTARGKVCFGCTRKRRKWISMLLGRWRFTFEKWRRGKILERGAHSKGHILVLKNWSCFPG